MNVVSQVRVGEQTIDAPSSMVKIGEFGVTDSV